MNTNMELTLAKACRKLGVPYWTLYQAVWGNVVPGHRGAYGPWKVYESDLPKIAAILARD